MSLLELHDISTAYGGAATAVHALDDIDLSAEPADVTATAAWDPPDRPAAASTVYPRRAPARRTGRAMQPGVQLPAARRAERPRSGPERPALALANPDRLQARTA
jgi:hypothetical protein